MSTAMMTVLQAQVESLSRQVQQLADENERVRKCLTEFALRHDRDQEIIKNLQGAVGAAEIATADPDGIDGDTAVQISCLLQDAREASERAQLETTEAGAKS